MLGIAREFHNDSICQGRVSGSTDWAQKSCTISGTGTHTLKWRYVKDGSETSGYDCGWVDYVQWSGTTQNPLPTTWETITYGYDSAGRRIEKAYDGQTVMKYLYACPELAERDGGHIIAEYDGNNSLLHKYIYGPGVDQPICMIETAGSAAYYYHYDGLGSVVALTNSAGSVVNLYEYSVYGEVSASDPNHPNRFLFTGRELDKDTGLYYYRARYYNPYIGRFLQTDPAGDGMNLYAYCKNSPIGCSDPFGLATVWGVNLSWVAGDYWGQGGLSVTWVSLGETSSDSRIFAENGSSGKYDFLAITDDDWPFAQFTSALWQLDMLPSGRRLLMEFGGKGNGILVRIMRIGDPSIGGGYDPNLLGSGRAGIVWDPDRWMGEPVYAEGAGAPVFWGNPEDFQPPALTLAHELIHAYTFGVAGVPPKPPEGSGIDQKTWNAYWEMRTGGRNEGPASGMAYTEVILRGEWRTYIGPTFIWYTRDPSNPSNGFMIPVPLLPGELANYPTP